MHEQFAIGVTADDAGDAYGAGSGAASSRRAAASLPRAHRHLYWRLHLHEMGIDAPGESDGGTECSFCGLTFADFRRTGRLGCPHCYETFGDQLPRLLRRIHGGVKHVGKVYLPPDPTASELEKLGFKIVIYPASALLSVTHVVGQVMAQLQEKGTTAHLMDNMVSLEDCFEVMGLSTMLAEDARFADGSPAVTGGR